jgi:multicomponent Na+:H+ antiporter subunit C
LEILGLYGYWVFAVLLMTGLYAVIARSNLVKKLIGLTIFQAAVFLLLITIGNVEGGMAPILEPDGTAPGPMSNPLPQVLVLTAIVVGIAVTALGLALVVRIREEYGSIEEFDIEAADADDPPFVGQHYGTQSPLGAEDGTRSA